MGDELRRILRGELEGTRRLVEGAGRGHSARRRDEAVHGARKSLKRTRAVLRLMRDGLGRAAYRRLNLAMRDAARPLSEVRDAKVFVAACAALRASDARPATATALGRIERRLRANLRAVSERVLGDEELFSTVAAAVVALRAQVQGRHPRGGRAALERGLERTYGRVRRAYRVARERSSRRRLHEWRKQAKYFLYQLQILEPAWGAPERTLVGRLAHLTELLGRDHDLAGLRVQVKQRGVRRLIDHRRTALQRQALAVGREVFGPRPAARVRARLHRLASRW